MSQLNKQRKGKEHLPPFRYSSLFYSWRSAALAYDPKAIQRTAEAHSRMIERLFGPLDPWFNSPRRDATCLSNYATVCGVNRTTTSP